MILGRKSISEAALRNGAADWLAVSDIGLGTLKYNGAGLRLRLQTGRKVSIFLQICQPSRCNGILYRRFAEILHSLCEFLVRNG